MRGTRSGEASTFSIDDLWGEHDDYRTDPKFYDFAANHPDKTRQTICHNYSYKTGDWSGQQMAARLEEQLGPRYLGLLLDPGIACRLDDFLKFAGPLVASGKVTGPASLRQRYSDHLGNEQIWRGDMIGAELAGQLRRMSPEERVQYLNANEFLRTKQKMGKGSLDACIETNSKNIFYPLLCDEKPSGYYRGVSGLQASHITTTEPLFLSFSKRIEVTHIASSFGGKDRAVFMLMGSEAPKLDFVTLTGPMTPYSARETYRVPAGWNPRFQMPMSDPDFELLLFGARPVRARITEAHVYDELPERYAVGPFLSENAKRTKGRQM